MTAVTTNPAARHDLQAFMATDPNRRPATSSDAAAPAFAEDSFASRGPLINPSGVAAAGAAGSATVSAVSMATSMGSFGGYAGGLGSMGGGIGSWGATGAIGASGMGSGLGAASGLYDDGFALMSRGFRPAGVMSRGYGVMSYGDTFAQGASGIGARVNTFKQGITAMKRGLKTQVGIGTAIGAAISLANNAYNAIKGRISPGEAAGNVATDTVTSAVSATGGAVLGGVATAALGAMGIAGLPLTLLGLGAALGGGILADRLFRKTGIDETIHTTVSNAFSRIMPDKTPPPQPTV